LKEELTLLQKKARGKLLLGTGMVALFAIAGLCWGIYIVLRSDGSTVMNILVPLALLLMVGIFAAAVFVTFVYVPVLRDYETAYHQKVVESALAELDQITYYPNRGMRHSFLEETQMIKAGNRYLCSDYIAGNYHGVLLSQNYAAILQQHRKKKRWITDAVHLRGRWTRLKAGAVFDGTVYVFAKKAHDVPVDAVLYDHRGALKGAARIKTGDASFDQAFQTFATAEGEALRLLDDEMRAQITALAEGLSGKLMLCFEPEATHLVMVGAGAILGGGVFLPVEEEPAKAVRGEFDLLERFADEIIKRQQ
jgi:hypothetical protein